MSTKEQTRLQILNGVLEERWSMIETAEILGVSERQGWRTTFWRLYQENGCVRQRVGLINVRASAH
ncbi:MAG: helix-turn-helix domain-containing protein [Deltaproteobacteria bacterium]|nr:helix-turn-helix domain-containing protein [Deltaproteobacteria bacterium]